MREARRVGVRRESLKQRLKMRGRRSYVGRKEKDDVPRNILMFLGFGPLSGRRT